MNILESYLNEINMSDNIQYISEDIQSFTNKLKSINLKNTIKSLDDSAKLGNMDKIKNILNSIRIPTISNEIISKSMEKLFPSFRESYELSRKVIKNSVNHVPDKYIDPLAISVAIKSNVKSKDPIKDTKENLIHVVEKIRKYIGPQMDVKIGIIIIIISIISGISIVLLNGFSFISLAAIAGLLIFLKNLVEV